MAYMKPCHVERMFKNCFIFSHVQSSYSSWQQGEQQSFHYWKFLRGIQGWSLDFPHNWTVIVCIPLGLKISKKLSLVTLFKFYIFNNLIRISEKILQKSNWPIDKFYLPHAILAMAYMKPCHVERMFKNCFIFSHVGPILVCWWPKNNTKWKKKCDFQPFIPMSVIHFQHIWMSPGSDVHCW